VTRELKGAGQSQRAHATNERTVTRRARADASTATHTTNGLSDLVRHYARVGNDPTVWLTQARSLFVAATLLRRHSALLGQKPGSRPPAFRERDVIGGMLLLRAFAVECLLKTVWLCQGQLLVRDHRYKGVPGVNNHNLPGLCGKLGIGLTSDERDMLARLTS
jgi:hypothetical protein